MRVIISFIIIFIAVLILSYSTVKLYRQKQYISETSQIGFTEEELYERVHVNANNFIKGRKVGSTTCGILSQLFHDGKATGIWVCVLDTNKNNGECPMCWGTGKINGFYAK